MMIKLKRSVLAAILASILVISKEILAFLPNVELVSFLLIEYTLTLGYQLSFISAVIFAFLQMLLYGIGLWTPMYFIVWPMLTLVTYIFKKKLSSEYHVALFSGIFGLIFGFLFSLPYFIIDIQAGVAFFIKGIPFDLIHGISNYLIMLVLYEPITKVLRKQGHKFKIK